MIMAFSVSSGQIIGPDGQPFQARGINTGIIGINGRAESVAMMNTMASSLTSTFPHVNMIRVTVWQSAIDQGLNAADFKAAVDTLTAAGVVVEFEYHELTSTLTGGALTSVANWYSGMATAFKGNDHVWFGSQNEPPGGAIDTEISTLYNAVRGTGNNTPFMMGVNGGYTTNGLNPSVYNSMHNVVWDTHFYSWEVNGLYGLDPNNAAQNAQALANQLSSTTNFTHSADGTIPIIIGEYGPAVGNGFDAGGYQVVASVQQSGVGSLAWGWECFNSGDPIPGDLVKPGWTGGPGNLTEWGQSTAQFIAAGGVPSFADVVTGTGPDVLMLNICEDAYNGNAQFTLAVDGKQQGNTFTAGASHAAGAEQKFIFNGYFGIGSHTVAVNFLNDAYGGTAATDRNLYVDSVTYKGASTNQSAALKSTGVRNFAISGGTAPVTPSPDGTMITSTSASPIIDKSGNAWSLVQSASSGLQIAVNGTVDPVTANVVLLETLGGNMVQQNSAGNWYSEAGPTGSWTQIPAPPPASVTTGSESDTLVLSISEDAYANGDGTSDAKGDAAFTVSVDGKQLAGTFFASALHSAGASQNFAFKGDWAAAAHAVAVNFLNDAYAGTAATDRNLYVNGVTYNGTNTNQSGMLATAGPQSFNLTDSTALPVPVIGGGSDTLLLKVSEDYYLGNAQFTVAVDGKQLGGTLTATTLRASGGSQAFAFKGDFGAAAHTVSVKFLNDAYAGTAATDRNLYVNDIVYNGTDTHLTASLMGAGAKTFSVSGGTTPAVTETGDHGSLQKDLSQTGSYGVGGDTFVLTAGNVASVTLGSGASQVKFVGPSSVTLTGGSGQATVTADAGNNKFVAGTGSLDVTGGAGKDAYVFHATGGLLTLEDFSLAKGDTLTIDKSLQGSLHQATDGKGGTMLTFGTDTSHGVDIRGLASVSSSTGINWA
jgi:hypothetical protein